MALDANGKVMLSSDGGSNWIIGEQINTGGGLFSVTSGRNNMCLKYNNGLFVARDNNGTFYSSPDGFNWESSPGPVVSIHPGLNSNNFFIKSSGGMAYSSGTSLDTFTHIKYASNFGPVPSRRRMIYVGGTYLVGSSSGGIISSQNLSDWSSVSVSPATINNITYMSLPSSGGNVSGLAYSGTGSNFIVASVTHTPTSSNDNVNISKLSNLTTSLGLGAATAGILELY
jgi:hypothetical protein